MTNGNQYDTPYGSNRGGTPFSTVTTKRFTGQYHENGLTQSEGLSYYNARWYDAKLGRFLSADSIVPGSANPQAFNRYSYVLNNPLKYIDPTGHGHMCTADPYDPGCAGDQGRSRPSTPSSASVVTCAGMGCFRPVRQRPPVVVQSRLDLMRIFDYVPTFVGGQVGVGGTGNFFFGAEMDFDLMGGCALITMQCSILWNNTAGVRFATSELVAGNLHAGVTVAHYASSINSLLGASTVQSFDIQSDAVARVGVNISHSRAYNFVDENGDGAFTSAGSERSEPLTDPYIDPFFKRQVSATSVNLSLGANAIPNRVVPQ